ncbi:MAG: MOSC domain-containing protein [Eubacteriales bacterium]|nr:MOSC domain-containing protein [Eubacteriales bacterium]MDD3350529.1 MOSC domain-containing protein [Eubacteriales bacterium]
MKAGRIHSISISPERGQLKKEVLQARVIESFGIENDGHAGDWGRQITCLDYDSVKASNTKHNLCMSPGDFAENLLLDGIDFSKISVGNKLKLGTDVILEVAQIGKEDHPSIVSRTFGVSLLPGEGLFCKVLSGGLISRGDSVEIVSEEEEKKK